MSYETTQQLIDHVRTIHQSLSDHYNHVWSESHKPMTQMLLDYLSTHESRLSNALQRYEEQLPDKLLNTWFQFTTTGELGQCVANGNINADSSPEELLDFAIRMDDCLINFYKSMYDEAETKPIRELFGDLLAMEEAEERLMVKQMLSANDL